MLHLEGPVAIINPVSFYVKILLDDMVQILFSLLFIKYCFDNNVLAVFSLLKK